MPKIKRIRFVYGDLTRGHKVIYENGFFDLVTKEYAKELSKKHGIKIG